MLSSCASAPPSAPADLVAIEQQWVDALRTHDTAFLDRLLDDSFVDSTFRGGIRTKADVLTGPPAGGPYHSIRLEELKVRRYGRDTAIVTGVNVLEGKDPSDLARIRFTDIFLLRDGHWRAVSAQETLQQNR
ncbi:MAG: nuclear transport factor 2 family protein [Thermoanaerobaculia bacterium]